MNFRSDDQRKAMFANLNKFSCGGSHAQVRFATEPLEGVRGHKLMTAELKASIPALYSQENVSDPLVRVKYFSPWMNWEWYGIEFDGEDRFFGLVKGFDEELGYFSLSELSELEKGGVPMVERDLYFKPKKLSEVKGES